MINNRNLLTFKKFINEKKNQKKNAYAICTSSIGKKAGTTKRSEWTKKQKQEYDDCIEDIKNKN